MRRRSILAAIVSLSAILCGCQAKPAAIHSIPVSTTTRPARGASEDARFVVGPVLYHDEFLTDSGNWVSELEAGGVVSIGGGKLEINAPRGATVWFKPQLSGAVLIQYQATVISAGGANDRVSDLNCFWMARDARSSGDLFASSRSGKFSDYNTLRCYYVGLGGNGNTTTRFRRYIGDPVTRPLLAEHDLKGSENLLTPNTAQTIQLVACGKLIEYFRDGRRLFEYQDAEPYQSGWFAFRTTQNHMVISKFQVWRLTPDESR